MRWLRYDGPLHLVLLLTNWLPDMTIFLRLRGLLACPFFRSCGRNLRLGRDVSFYNPAAISIGSDVYMAHGTRLLAGEAISVADEVLFGPYCVIVSSSHTRRDGSYRFGPVHLAPVTIGRGVWLGAHVTVVAGAEVGAGTLVGANSVVTGVLPGDVLAGGLPAKVIRQLEESSLEG